MSRSRDFTFTINNYNEADVSLCEALASESSYMIVGIECGDEKGTPHLQGYVYFTNARSFSSVKKKLPRAHIESTKGSPIDNKRYCSKDGKVLFEHGTCPRQGARTDIEKTFDKLKSGANMRSVIETARSYQSIKAAEIYLKYNEEKREWKPEVKWFHGSTGSGKTRRAREWLQDDIYTCMDSAKWFEGYDKHENVLIDDFRDDWISFRGLLRFLDRYEYRVETKGGSRQLLAKKIAITCPYHPKYIYYNDEDVDQLIRRIDEIILVGDLVKSNRFRSFDGDEDLLEKNIMK